MFEMILNYFLTPAVLFFAAGLIASILRSDLEIPKSISDALSLYLLIAIGLKGGIELSKYPLSDLVQPIIAALILGCFIPFVVLAFLRKALKLDLKNSVALAATYGSVSIVTFGAGLSFLENLNVPYEGYMSGLVVLLEIPAIFISLMLLHLLNKPASYQVPHQKVGFVHSLPSLLNKEVLKESLLGKSVYVLTISLFIGYATAGTSVDIIKPFFIDLYPSVLILFLLNMGLVAGQQLSGLREHGFPLIAFGVAMPIFNGIIGVLLAGLIGLSVGGATLLGILAASASYIAAPAAMRASVPDANPSIYLGLALGITFPFNLAIGIPVFYTLSQWLFS
ncbi:sodium-dependent bicarbonate transport family permease [Halalkalibacter urbisdiaboli]|uniref:sodium-dependent bicarbonate transport family permease n=1 Tax=Halalkalibacter urbisdiaboli TaxID=1960589 RepID=UPI000B43E2DA|nr:sodium-dependent bicarbonate transport family permease [Halalkalibacter urbisdiaboli]